MTKSELVDAVQQQAGGLSKRATADLIDTIFGQIGTSVKKSGRFSYPGFGTFTLKQRKARTGRNPQTGAAIKIKKSKTVGFKPAPALKSSL